MEKKSFKLGTAPTIKIETVLGILKIKGLDSEEVFCESNLREFIEAESSKDTLTLSSKGNCSLRVPLKSNLIIDSVMGGIEINHVEGEINVKEIMGTANIFNASNFSAETLNGNSNIYHLDDCLTIKEVNGNLTLKDIFGQAEIDFCSGNVSVSGITGGFQINTSGNTILNIDPDPGKYYKVTSNGNIFCQVPANSGFEAKLNSESGMQINAPVIEVEESGPNTKHIQIGDGGSKFEFTANGKITISVEGHYGKFAKDFQGKPIEDILEFSSDIVKDTIASLELSLSDLNRDLKDLTINLGSDKNALRNTRKDILKARRDLERDLAASRRQIKRSVRRRVTGPDLVIKKRSDDPVSNEERVKILQMVENGQIEVEDAEMLLAAIEGKESNSTDE